MEFQKVMAEANRMCDSVFQRCKECPLDEMCGDPLSNPKLYEDLVMEWAKEHPVPIYPTILELIYHIAEKLPSRKDGVKWFDVPLNEIVKEQVPEIVAKELGLIPINACGLNKYCEEDSEWR